MKKDTVNISISIIIAGAIIAIGIIVGGVISNNGGTEPMTDISNKIDSNNKKTGLEIGNAPVLGNKDAPVILVEFADFQCPYCALFNNKTERKIVDQYVKTGKVKLVFKTLHFLDRNSQKQESYRAALAGECAKEQGRFWEMHDAIFDAEFKEIYDKKNSENNGNLNNTFFDNIAKTSGMDVNKFNSCMKSEKYKSQLDSYENDARLVSPAGISTPTIFVNGVKIVGARDFSVYQKAIDDVLSNLK